MSRGGQCSTLVPEGYRIRILCNFRVETTCADNPFVVPLGSLYLRIYGLPVREERDGWLWIGMLEMVDPDANDARRG